MIAQFLKSPVVLFHTYFGFSTKLKMGMYLLLVFTHSSRIFCFRHWQRVCNKNGQFDMKMSVRNIHFKKSGWLWFFVGLCCMSFAGWIIFPYTLYERIPQPIQFSHKVHSETAGMTCDNCHTLKDDGSFSGIPPISKCAECHADIIGTSPYEKKLVDEYIKPKKEIPWLAYSKQPQNVFFSHASHLKLANLPCEECHGAHGTSDSLPSFERNRITGYSRDISGRGLFGVKHGMTMDDCANCHKKHNIENTCLKCHK